MSHSAIAALRGVALGLCGEGSVFEDQATRRCFSYDAYTRTALPDLVVIPDRREQVAPLVRAAVAHGVPYVARGAGTGYSGGSIAVNGGLAIVLTRLDRIESVGDGWAVVEPGVITKRLQDAALAQGWRYPPDPSSHRVCTIGGNIAENAGGPHSLGLGMTSSFVLGAEVVTPDGKVRQVGGRRPHTRGLDVRGLIVGSEGTLGIVTRAWLRLVRPPERTQMVVAAFGTTGAALDVVQEFFRVGIVPAALDMSADAVGPRFADASDGSYLFIVCEGLSEEVREQVDRILRIAAAGGGQCQLHSPTTFWSRREAVHRNKIERVRAASGTPRYFLFDLVVPRSRLGEAAAHICRAASENGVYAINTFHVGDGNLHPTPFFDPSVQESKERVERFWHDVLMMCNSLGGSLTGEHGIGLDKGRFLPLFKRESAVRLEVAIRRGLDPLGLCNPRKATAEVDAEFDYKEALSPLEVPSAAVVDVVDGVVTAPCHTTFGELEKLLASTPYEMAWWPIGVGQHATLGTAINRGAPGLREARTGPSRDLLLGGVLELPRGPLLEFGSRMAKDVSGYDIRKLVFGSQGQLGQILSAHLKLSPRPAATAAWVNSAESIDEAIESLNTIEGMDLPLSALGLLGNLGRLQIIGILELWQGNLAPLLRHLRHHSRFSGATWMTSQDAYGVLTSAFAAGNASREGWSAGTLMELEPLLAEICDDPTARFFALPGMELCWWSCPARVSRGVDLGQLPEADPELQRLIADAFHAVQ